MAGRSIMPRPTDQPSGGAEQATIPRTERPTPRSTRPSNRDREALRRGLKLPVQTPVSAHVQVESGLKPRHLVPKGTQL